MLAEVKALVEEFKLLPHPEGGFYKETYRSPQQFDAEIIFNDVKGSRNFSTAIYFLIEKNNFSALHRIKSDEIWHFYTGDALEVIEIDASGNLKTTLIGNKYKNGEVFQYTVKANTWFGSRVVEGGEFSLVGCTVSPGFDFNDFELAHRDELLREFPRHRKVIEEMTRI